MIEYFDGIGFGREDEPQAHVHEWLCSFRSCRDLPGMAVYDCGCGVRRIVPEGTHPDNGEDALVRPYPESCPTQTGNLVNSLLEA